MGVSFIALEKSIMEIIEQLLSPSDIPSMPSEIVEVQLKDIYMYPNDNPEKDKPWIVKGTKKYTEEKFLLYAEYDYSSDKYTYAWMIQFNGSHTYTLGEMELFGKKLPELNFISLTLQHLVFADEEITRIKSWNRMIVEKTGDATLLFPEEVMYEGVRLRASLTMGQVVIPVNLFLGFGDDNDVLNPVRSISSSLRTDTDYRREQWYDFQYTLGPLTFKRIGLRYAKGNIYLQLDALLAVSGVELNLEGLSLSTSIWEWKPKYHLSGMKLSYDISHILMSGGLLESSEPGRYGGFAVVEAFDRSFSAVGSYATRAGVPSLFVYIRADEEIGGPPYFYVEKLGLGFGVNKRFLEPKIEDVAKLPLLKGDEEDKVLSELENSSRPWIRNEIGTSWLAVGIEFTTFKFIRSKALLIGQFGKELELLLLGQSTLELPDHKNRFVFIETVLKGNWRPSEGFVGITGKITDNSFLFSKDCSITGDYAAWFWYNKGDFIISAGGYHPQFRKPDHYPSLSRIAVNWPLGWGTIKGNAYFALTPSCIMGGGCLELSYGGGDIKACLTAYADVLARWKPFYFDASFGVNVGASVRLHHRYVGSYTLKVEFGADFQLWGQPTGGQVHLGYKHFGITIKFGDKKTNIEDKIKQDEFIAMLPGNDKFVKIHPKRGLIRELSGGEWIVQPENMEFTVQTDIPVINLSSGREPVKNISPDPNIKPGIQPMGVHEMEESLLQIYLIKNDYDTTGDLDFDAIIAGVPEALWGTGGSEVPNANILSHAMGIVGVTKPSPDKPVGDKVDLQQKYETEPVNAGADIAAINSTRTRGIPVLDDTSIALIKDTISNREVSKKRRDTIEALFKVGIYPEKCDDMMSRLADDAQNLFYEPPMVLKTS